MDHHHHAPILLLAAIAVVASSLSRLHRSPFTLTTPPVAAAIGRETLQSLRCRALLLALPSFGALRSEPLCRVVVCLRLGERPDHGAVMLSSL